MLIVCDDKTHSLCCEYATKHYNQLKDYIWHVEEHGKIIREDDAIEFLRGVLV